MGACRPTAPRRRAPSLRTALHPIPTVPRPSREERLGPEPCGPCTLPPPRIAQSLEPPTPTWCTDARRPHRTPPRPTPPPSQPPPARDPSGHPLPTRTPNCPHAPARPIRPWPPTPHRAPTTAPAPCSSTQTHPLLSTPTPRHAPDTNPGRPRACVPRRSPPSPRDPRPRPDGAHSRCTPTRTPRPTLAGRPAHGSGTPQRAAVSVTTPHGRRLRHADAHPASPRGGAPNGTA